MEYTIGKKEFFPGIGKIKYEGREIDKMDIMPRQRTDDVEVRWR